AAEGVFRGDAGPQLVLLGQRKLGDAVEAGGLDALQLLPIERRALEEVRELLAEGGVVERELLLPGAHLDLGLERWTRERTRRGSLGLGSMAEHREQARVAWVDTDAGGRIHFTAAFRWAEVAETGLFRKLGLLAGGQYGNYPRRRVEADYLQVLVFEDELD